MAEIEEPKSKHPPLSAIIGAAFLTNMIVRWSSESLHHPIPDWQQLIIAILTMLLAYRFL